MAFRTALIEETAAFGEIIRTADLDTEVPTCPGWTMKQLFKHVGRGNRWCAQIVADHLKEPLDRVAELAVSGGQQGLMHVNVSRPQYQAVKPTSHDPQQHLHQQ